MTCSKYQIWLFLSLSKYGVFFWSIISRIRTEYGISLRIQSECAPVASPVDHFAESELPVPNYGSPANKWNIFLPQSYRNFNPGNFGILVKLVVLKYFQHGSTIICIIFWDFLKFNKFSSQHKWSDTRLLLISMVCTCYITSCQAT